MSYLMIVLAVLNVTLIVLGIAFFQPIRCMFANMGGGQPDTPESDANRTWALFQSIHDTLSAHADGLNSVEQNSHDVEEMKLDDIRRSNRETSTSLDSDSKQLDMLLGKYGDMYRSERLRIDSYAKNVGDLDDLLREFENEAEGSNRVLLQLVRDMLQENRQLQSKVSDCQEQVSDLIVRSAKSERDARTDALTKLPNRRAWDEKLMNLRSLTSIALVDVDDFKMINDGYGHAAGDAMLQLIGTILRNTHDVAAYRIGGDEFALLIPPGSEEEIAERIRKKITTSVLQFANEKLSVSVSIGVARPSGQNDPWEMLLRRADDALYKAKETKGAADHSCQLA